LLQFLFLLPSLLIAAPFLRAARGESIDDRHADAFDRRIVTLLTFGPAVTVVLVSFASGRGTIETWGYPLWLFFGLWLVLHERALDLVALARIVVLWAVVSIAYVVAFVVNYDILPRYNHHYYATMFPGQALGQEMSRRYQAMTGRALAYVIGSMWDGGNVSRYAPERPRVLIDGDPRRAPWIDLGDLRSKGAVVVWTDSRDPRVLPRAYRMIAADAEVQPPFELAPHLGGPTVRVGWAILRPRPTVAWAVTPAP
jgi:hypothetical protein